jgi:CheY-like chemotaxis protein
VAKRILVVEDNDLNRKLFCDVLKANGYIEVILTQDYESSRLNSYGLKALYLRKREDGTYRILTETWKDLPPKQFTALNRWTQ